MPRFVHTAPWAHPATAHFAPRLPQLSGSVSVCHVPPHVPETLTCSGPAQAQVPPGPPRDTGAHAIIRPPRPGHTRGRCHSGHSPRPLEPQERRESVPSPRACPRVRPPRPHHGSAAAGPRGWSCRSRQPAPRRCRPPCGHRVRGSGVQNRAREAPAGWTLAARLRVAGAEPEKGRVSHTGRPGRWGWQREPGAPRGRSSRAEPRTPGALSSVPPTRGTGAGTSFCPS